MTLAMAVICASNQNRSMMAHKVLSQNNFNIHSYGTGYRVSLPGPTADVPNVYRFGTPYQDMYSDLSNQDTSLYTRNGILALLDRNKNIKPAPERFQDNHLVFNVLITCEQRCFDAVCEELMRRGGINNKPVHVINVEIKDSIEEASKGAQIILSVANELRSAEQMLEERIWDILEEARVKHGDIFLYHVSYY